MMKISKHNFDVFEGEEHQMLINGEVTTQVYAWVIFFEQEYIYRHNKTFDTYKEAYSFMLKIFFSADVRGAVTIDEKHWGITENTIAC